MLRGLHFQHGEFLQFKLFRVLSGTVIYIFIMVREHSNTFSRPLSVELISESRTQFFR